MQNARGIYGRNRMSVLKHNELYLSAPELHGAKRAAAGARFFLDNPAVSRIVPYERHNVILKAGHDDVSFLAAWERCPVVISNLYIRPFFINMETPLVALKCEAPDFAQ